MIEELLLRVKLFFAYLRCKERMKIPTEGKKIFVFLGADYGNLGDVAITYAQTQYLQHRFLEYKVVEIPISNTFAGIKTVKNIINSDDVVTLIGGGNTSDRYDDIEFLRQLVIWNFRKYRIIGFPQTIDLTRSGKGMFTQMTIKLIYRRAHRFTYMAREQNSFNVMSRLIPALETVKMPDVVMTLDERENAKRNGLLVCLRSDKEVSSNATLREEALKMLTDRYASVDYQDTQVDGISLENRYEKLHEVWRCFSRHEVVLTDRLHGMIFAFITNTPAYVIDNSNHKISACLECIRNCGYIRLIKKIDDIDPILYASNFKAVRSEILNKYDTLSCLKFH